MTKNGNPDRAPAVWKSAGSAAEATSPITAPMATLIHHGERSRIANSEFSDIFQFSFKLGLQHDRTGERGRGKRPAAMTVAGPVAQSTDCAADISQVRTTTA